MKDTEKFAGAKYVIKANFTIEGVVEKHDVIGAIFGQTEGLFPKELELRELQKSGKIGRIDINLKSSKDSTRGTIIAPSSLDRAETALIAAAMETVDRVGPCESKINVENITDVRVEKRQKIVERAKELMRDWVVKDGQEIEKLLDEVQKEDKKIKAVHYGRERLTATPDISKSDEIIIVEGRADVNNLIKSGVTGVIAMEGVKVPKTIRNLTSRKEVTAFLDGDRGGDLILQELMQVAPPTYVARAPRGKEVEELSPEEIDKALDAKRPLEDAKAKPEPEEKAPRFSEEIVNLTNDLRGTLEAVLIKTDGKQDERIPVSELVEKLKDANDVKLVVFDGIVTGRLIDTAREKNIDTIIGERVAEGVRIPRGVEVRSFKNLN
ncbi:DNA primase [Candidatus Bathyarchaeota archaeon]|nr:MAG: DNA primase [Candidatus Bathyarchaeota archaeon]